MSHIARLVLALGLGLTLAACGGGSSGSSSSTSKTSSNSSTGSGGTSLTNYTTVTVDSGPAALTSGANAAIALNVPYVTVTICAPGSTTNCQTIDHVLLDTGSVGLRLLQPVLNSTLLAALPEQTDASGNPVGECYGFVDSYLFGSVRSVDFTIGGESVHSMPVQVVGDTGAFASVPSSCSNTGGVNEDTVQTLGANAIIGIGFTPTDCGSACTVAGGSAAAIYYDCPSTGCSAIVARTSATTAPFQQLPNPVAAFAADNNGTILSLPSVASGGAASVTGTLYFGIGTQSNNALGSATVLTLDGNGFLTATYNGTSLPDSFIDSGSNLYYFVDSTIAACTATNFTAYYCPASPLLLSPTLKGGNGTTASGAFTLYNAQTELAANVSAVPGVGANPNASNFANPINNSFDFGLPFFFGRNVYTAISGRSAGGTAGPYNAF